jgi:predicted nucleic acid-binding protein
MIGYADTSFLVSLYLPDVHSPAAWSAMKSRPYLYLTPLHELEFVNAIELAIFRRLINRVEAKSVLRDFEQDRGNIFSLTQLPSETYARAEQLARRYTSVIGTRSLDILQVAAALILKPNVFFTFDDRQQKLAKAEHMRVLPAKSSRKRIYKSRKTLLNHN